MSGCYCHGEKMLSYYTSRSKYGKKKETIAEIEDIEEEAIPIHEPQCDVDAFSEGDEEENVTAEIGEECSSSKKINFCDGGIDNCIKDDH